jgi:hypothetical protein
VSIDPVTNLYRDIARLILSARCLLVMPLLISSGSFVRSVLCPLTREALGASRYKTVGDETRFSSW